MFLSRLPQEGAYDDQGPLGGNAKPQTNRAKTHTCARMYKKIDPIFTVLTTASKLNQHAKWIVSETTKYQILSGAFFTPQPQKPAGEGL